MRLNALRRVMGSLNQAEFAAAHDLNASYLSQLLSGHRSFGERAATNMEKKIGLKPGTLSRPPSSDAQESELSQPSVASGDPLVTASVRRVPIISSVQAGDWCDAEDPYPVGQGEGSVLVEADKVSASAFAVRCEGPSMEPRFYDGDVLVVDPHREALNGNFVIAKKTSTNSVNFKQLVVEAGEVYLKALNPDWPQRIIKIDEDWHICGVVVHRVEDLV